MSKVLAAPPGHIDRLTGWLVLASYLGALLVFVAAFILTLEGQIWVAQVGDVSSISLASISVIYVLAEYRFWSAGFSQVKAVVLAVLFANAFLQLYELLYGLSWGLAALLEDPVSITGGDVRNYLLWLVMISPIVIVHDKLRFTRTSAAFLFLTGAVWVVWLLYGFPQYYLSGYFLPQILKTSNPYHLSLWLNFGTKTLLAVFFISLLEPLQILNKALRRG